MALWLDELPSQDVLDGTRVLEWTIIQNLKPACPIFEHKPLLKSYVPRDFDQDYFAYISQFNL